MKKIYSKSKSKGKSSNEVHFTFSLKQLLITLLLIISFSHLNAQCTARALPYLEDFSTNPFVACTPTAGGWDSTGAASGAGWWVPSPPTNYAGGTAPEVEAYGNQSNGGISETIRLTSPPIKTLGLSSASLSFKHNLYLTNSGTSGSNSIGIGVEMSADKISWTPLYANIYAATSSLTSVVMETRTIALNGLSSDSIFLRFNISGVLFKVWGWEIDNVNVTSGTTSLPVFHSNDLIVYPNPVKEMLTVSTGNIRQAKIILSDIFGNTVYTSQMTGEKLSIDVSAFPKGIYLLQMQNENQVVSKKINIE